MRAVCSGDRRSSASFRQEMLTNPLQVDNVIPSSDGREPGTNGIVSLFPFPAVDVIDFTARRNEGKAMPGEFTGISWHTQFGHTGRHALIGEQNGADHPRRFLADFFFFAGRPVALFDAARFFGTTRGGPDDSSSSVPLPRK